MMAITCVLEYLDGVRRKDSTDTKMAVQAISIIEDGLSMRQEEKLPIVRKGLCKMAVLAIAIIPASAVGTRNRLP